MDLKCHRPIVDHPLNGIHVKVLSRRYEVLKLSAFHGLLIVDDLHDEQTNKGEVSQPFDHLLVCATPEQRRLLSNIRKISGACYCSFPNDVRTPRLRELDLGLVLGINRNQAQVDPSVDLSSTEFLISPLQVHDF